MAAAKGLCYALSLPLLAVPTLQMMCVAALPQVPPGHLLCPMIDARRMEVFTAVFDDQLSELLPATNLVLDSSSYTEWLANAPVAFFGNGSEKAKDLLNHPGALFVTVEATAEHMAVLAYEKFAQRQFSDLAYATPYYGKEFYSPVSTKKS